MNDQTVTMLELVVTGVETRLMIREPGNIHHVQFTYRQSSLVVPNQPDVEEQLTLYAECRVKGPMRARKILALKQGMGWTPKAGDQTELEYVGTAQSHGGDVIHVFEIKDLS